MSERDPRIDPATGDVVQIQHFAGGCVAHVKDVKPRKGRNTMHVLALLCDDCGRKIDINNNPRLWSLSTWRSMCAFTHEDKP